MELPSGKRRGLSFLTALFLVMTAYLAQSYYEVWQQAWWQESFPRFKLWSFTLIPLGTALLLGYRLLVPHSLWNVNATARKLCLLLIIASFLSPIGFAFFRPLKASSIDSHPKSSLNWFYSAGDAYWKDKGRDQVCGPAVGPQRKIIKAGRQG